MTNIWNRIDCRYRAIIDVISFLATTEAEDDDEGCWKNAEGGAMLQRL